MVLSLSSGYPMGPKLAPLPGSQAPRRMKPKLPSTGLSSYHRAVTRLPTSLTLTCWPVMSCMSTDMLTWQACRETLHRKHSPQVCQVQMLFCLLYVQAMYHRSCLPFWPCTSMSSLALSVAHACQHVCATMQFIARHNLHAHHYIVHTAAVSTPAPAAAAQHENPLTLCCRCGDEAVTAAV